MPGERQHLDQARHNEGFLSTIDRAKYSDWAVTTLFYSSLHYVDACLARRGVHPRLHDARENDLKDFHDLKELVYHYIMLRNASRRSRYDCRRPDLYQVQLAERELGQVKQKALQGLGHARS
jgi:hypothetical protein